MPRSLDYIGATGIGVSDLERSAKFYQDALGMVRARDIKLPHMDEIILTHPGRNAVVLMNWTDGSARSYRDLPVKLVFYVADPYAVTERIRDAGGLITREPQPLASDGKTIVVLGKDPDGYVIELLQAPPPRDA
jgi:catechol 2,3-dioxygenase-like lactoylglutathione lyase family enzyme